LRSLKLPLSLATIPLFLLLLATTAVAGGGATIWVDDDCTPPGTGTELDPFCTIQDAWDDPGTLAGDTIRVRPGTYNECPEEPISPAEKPVELVADAWLLNPTDPADDASVQALTVIDGTGTCDVAEVPAVLIGHGSRLAGFTITNGGDSGVFSFGGSTTIENNVIRDNSTPPLFGGGGIFAFTLNCEYGDTTTIIRNNWILENDVPDGDGGGIALEAGPEFLPGVDCPSPGVATVLIEGNVIEDHVLPEGSGAGAFIATKTFTTTQTVDVTIRDNEFNDNQALSATPQFDFGLGGGLQITQAAADSSGVGTERVVIEDNLFQSNAAFEVGGGISTETIATNPGSLQISIRSNQIFDNAAAGGGGIDAFLSVRQVPGASTPRQEVLGNDIFGNVAGFLGGGGISATMEVFLSNLAGTDKTLEISGNRIIGNTVEGDTGVVDGGGGGALLFSKAREILGVPTPASSSIEFHDNLVASNASTDFGVGVETVLLACESSTATVDISGSTIARNTEIDGGQTGLDFVALAPGSAGFGDQCPSLIDSGLSTVTVRESIVASNGTFGIGGVADPNLTVTVSDSDVFGHAQNFEPVLGASLVQQNNVSVDPQFVGGTDDEDPAYYAPAVCSPVHDLGTDGLGFWQSADVTGDDEVDGIDLLRLAVSFGAGTGDARFDPTADLDRDGFVGPDDLATLAADFGSVCN
jgi:hypothetical protein